MGIRSRGTATVPSNPASDPVQVYSTRICAHAAYHGVGFLSYSLEPLRSRRFRRSGGQPSGPRSTLRILAGPLCHTFLQPRYRSRKRYPRLQSWRWRRPPLLLLALLGTGRWVLNRPTARCNPPEPVSPQPRFRSNSRAAFLSWRQRHRLPARMLSLSIRAENSWIAS